MGEDREDEAGAEQGNPGTPESADVDDEAGRRSGLTSPTVQWLHPR